MPATNATQLFGKDFFADRLRSLFAKPVESDIGESRPVGLDDERTHCRGAAIVVGIEMPQRTRPEGLRERFESPGGAEPGEPVIEIAVVPNCAANVLRTSELAPSAPTIRSGRRLSVGVT
jgi:hypothetical protein